MRKVIEFFARLLLKYLQRKYKTLTANALFNQTNSNINRLILIQSIIYYLKSEFEPWGYFHTSCMYNKEHKLKIRKLFPEKDFPEVAIVVHHKPEAVTYYQNKIFTLSNNCSPIYAEEIKQQLKMWKAWY